MAESARNLVARIEVLVQRGSTRGCRDHGLQCEVGRCIPEAFVELDDKSIGDAVIVATDKAFPLYVKLAAWLFLVMWWSVLRFDDSCWISSASMT